MISADFEGFVTPHHETNLFRFFVLKQTNVSGPSFLPLRTPPLKMNEPEQLGATCKVARQISKASNGIKKGVAYNL